MAPKESLLCTTVSETYLIPNVECRSSEEDEQEQDENKSSPETNGEKVTEKVDEPSKQPERHQ